MTTARATVGPILAVDLGKHKCVACLYRAADAYTFHALDTSRPDVARPMRRAVPAGVVIEACSLDGCVHDLCYLKRPHSGTNAVQRRGKGEASVVHG